MNTDDSARESLRLSSNEQDTAAPRTTVQYPLLARYPQPPHSREQTMPHNYLSTAAMMLTPMLRVSVLIAQGARRNAPGSRVPQLP